MNQTNRTLFFVHTWSGRAFPCITMYALDDGTFASSTCIDLNGGLRKLASFRIVFVERRKAVNS